MLLEQEYTQENWTRIKDPNNPNNESIKHNHANLEFRVKYDPVQSYIEYEIYEASRMLGANSSWGVPSLDQWVSGFIHNGDFNVFLSNQDLRIF